jgi:hypothetical protein
MKELRTNSPFQPLGKSKKKKKGSEQQPLNREEIYRELSQYGSDISNLHESSVKEEFLAYLESSAEEKQEIKKSTTKIFNKKLAIYKNLIIESAIYNMKTTQEEGNTTKKAQFCPQLIKMGLELLEEQNSKTGKMLANSTQLSPTRGDFLNNRIF